MNVVQGTGAQDYQEPQERALHIRQLIDESTVRSSTVTCTLHSLSLRRRTLTRYPALCLCLSLVISVSLLVYVSPVESA